MQRMLKFGIVLACSLIAFFIAEVATVRDDNHYRFLHGQHPVDMELGTTGRWFYYSLPGSVKDVATSARTELAAQNFVEDAPNPGWVHFKNGSKEIILADSSRIWMVKDFRSGRVTFADPKLPTPKGYAPGRYCVAWVHEEGGTALQRTCFKIKKKILLW